jgi:multidrug/hemolysin transport system permease protein
MKELIFRHIKVFTRDRIAFFMSFLSVAILIIMYKIFLGQFQIAAINEAMGTAAASQSAMNMVNYWLIAGVVTITALTATLGAYGVMVSDKEKGRVLDFQLTAISNGKLQSTYIISAVIIGTLTSFCAYLFGTMVFVGGGALFSAGIKVLALVFLIILVAAILSILMIYPICKLIKEASAFTTLSTIIGTVIGFIAGIYISIGSVSSIMQKIMTYFPLTQINALLKQILMEDSLHTVFADAPQAALNSYRQNYGVDLSFDGTAILSIQQMISYLAVAGLVLLLFNFALTKMTGRVKNS